MTHPKTFLTLLALITLSLPAWAARELVDDFDGTTMDFSKWSGFDSANDITEYFVGVNVDVGGKAKNQTLVLINVGDGSALFRHQKSRAVIRNPDLSAIEATISVVSVEDGGGTAAAKASLEGQFYNTLSAAPINQEGDVFATVWIGDRGNGLEARWEILVSTHPTFETWNQTSGTIIGPAGNLNLETPYVAKIEYDEIFNRFTFTVDGTNIQKSGPPRMGSPYFTSQSLSTTTRCCGASPAIHATFDDVSIGNVLKDQFFVGPYLDRTVWLNHSGAVVLSSRVDPAVDDKLFMYVSDGQMLRDERAGTNLFLRERNPDRIEARVSVSGDSLLEPGILGRARLDGYAYNDRRDGGVIALPYDGCDGDVRVQVEIQMQNGALYATAFAGSELSNCEIDEILIDEDFTTPLAFDTEYLLWIERDGNRLQLGLDDEMVEHSITTQIYPPSPAAGNGFRSISSRIEGTPTSDVDGADGVFAMLIDNVYIISNDEDGNGGGGSSSSSSSCFIATAAYGSYLAPQVLSLRKFRDQHLLTNPVGEGLVEFYYRHSPPIADYIRDRETLRAVVRSGLALVVYSIEYPIAAGFILVLPPLVLLRHRRRQRNHIRLL